jgi:hypothetical protein
MVWKACSTLIASLAEVSKYYRKRERERESERERVSE